MSKIQDIPVRKIDGTEAKLKNYDGKVLLIVNVASKCGLTPQYEGLEKIYRQYKGKGFEVLGFPANNFMGQEPGTNEEIADFCKMKFDVSFPMFQKISVKGDDRHPLYAELTSAKPTAQVNPEGMLEKKLTEKGLGRQNPSDVLWNFEKFLVDKKGNVVERFAPDVTADSKMITAKIENLLNA